MKSKPIGIRFDNDDLEFVKKRQGLKTAQQVVHFLTAEYCKLYKVEKKSVFDVEMGIQDLTKPTNQIKAITDPKPTTNVTYHTERQETPNLSPFDGYKMELKDAKVIPEVELILVNVRMDGFLSPAQKKLLENYGKEVSKEMYND